MYYSTNELYHHGILGQKWGVRRYQNPDGSLTPAGKKRYGESFVEDPYDRSHFSSNLIKSRIQGLKKAHSEKAERKAYKNKILNDAVDYDNEFDGTESGKKLRKAYQKEIDRMMNTENWGSESDQLRFNKAESAYLSEQGRYTAKKIYSESGRKGLETLADRSDSGHMTVEELIDKIGSDSVRIHGV